MSPTRSTSRRWWAPAAIGAIAVAMIAVVVFGNNEPAEPAPPAATPEVTQVPEVDGVDEVDEPAPAETVRLDVERRDPADPLAIGAVDAPVTLVMISDFQCGFCALWANQTLPELLDLVDTGELRIEWRDIALFGEDSHRAALAAYAAGEQGEYLSFNQALFASGSAPDTDTISDEGLTRLAEDLGLDVEQFNTDRASERVVTAVQANIDEASNIGAVSTPAFLINGRPIIGAQPTPVFLTTIDEELAQTS